MLLFRAEEEIIRWIQATGEKRGEYLSLQQVWQLSKLWYSNRMSTDYRERTIEEAEAIFTQVGLTSNFWKFES